MKVSVIDTIKPKNGSNFPVVEAADVSVTPEQRLPAALDAKANVTDLNTTNDEVARKADISDVSAQVGELQNQIDQIVISASVEAVVAPEVAAARVAADGEEYSTLKQRIDAGNVQLQSEVDELESKRIKVPYEEVTPPISWRNGNCYQGEIQTAANRICTNRIYSPGSQYDYKRGYLTVPSGYKWRVSFFLEDGTLDHEDTSWRDGGGDPYVMQYASATVKYIIVSLRNSDDSAISPSAGAEVKLIQTLRCNAYGINLAPILYWHDYSYNADGVERLDITTEAATTDKISVNAGDRMWISSFKDGIRLDFWGKDGLVVSKTIAQTKDIPYLEVPEGATLVSIPCWKSTNERGYTGYPDDPADSEVYIWNEANISSIEPAAKNSAGKVVSFLGDSITTFAAEAGTGSGNKYAGPSCKTNYPNNRVRYPYSDVLNVEETWWMRVLKNYSWKLGINESWAGSSIAWNGSETTTSGENIYIGSQHRIDHLAENGTPDIIIVFGGTNDINHINGTAALGTLDTEDPTAYTSEDLAALDVESFYAAARTLILRLQYTYPEAQLLFVLPYYCTNNYQSTTPYTVKQYNDVLIDCCDYLGVPYVDLRKIINVYDISNYLDDTIHPDKAGMLMIAKAVIKKLDEIV